MKKLFAYSVILFWAVMAALFVRREVIPRLYAPPVRGYAGIRAYAQGHAGYRMGVTNTDGERIGHAETIYHLLDNGDCEITSEAVIDLAPRNGGESPAEKASGPKHNTNLRLGSTVLVGPDNALKSFQIACNTGLLSGAANGAVRGDSLRVIVQVAGVKSETELPITREDVVSSGIMALGALPDLRVGQTWRMRMFNPFSFQFTTAYVTVKRRTRLLLRGHWYPVFEVETRHDVGKLTTWVDRSGNVLRERAFNFVFTREPLPHELTGRPGEALVSTPARAAK